MAIGTKELMAENRTIQVNGNIEPSINRLVNAMLNNTGTTVSAYIRKLIIADLMDKGLLAQEELLEIVN